MLGSIGPPYYNRDVESLLSAPEAGTIMDARPEGSPRAASRPSSISSTLLDQLRARRPEAWQRLVRLYGPVIYRWCRRSNVGAEDSADVVQEVLSSVMVHLPDFHRDRAHDSFSAWIATITRNKVREQFRRQHGKAEARGGSTAQRQMAEIAQPPELSVESIQPDVDSASYLSRRVLETIRAEFETQTWDAFWRVSVDGRLAADIASELGMSVAAVYKAKSRILSRFRQVLAELSE
jgi:RNA polymerase sigma-70 factor, ECF subfamily